MSIFKKISERLHTKRVEKVSQKSSHHSSRTEYLLSNETPFDVTEAFRNLKASLSVSVPKKDGGVVIMMTSAYPEDGKTTVTANLALMFALSYAKVILIDADIRKGRIAKYFNKRTTPGLSDYLSGQKSLDEVVYHSKKYEHLSYITCGTHSPKPYELLESDEMKNLLENLRKEYDYIIIDTPPILLISDALALAPFTDGVALVCRHQVSYVSDIARALNSLSFAKANVLGVIVNDYKAPKAGKFYGGYKKYYYYNSYSYGSTNPNDSEDGEFPPIPSAETEPAPTETKAENN
ncbi:MAG: CpsD/CapB family tyrosine-protein kinase [Clostridia bacterium]|nr:CpsD/CapB family tyrosine-protein kinase [Clostridia bacterium]